MRTTVHALVPSVFAAALLLGACGSSASDDDQLGSAGAEASAPSASPSEAKAAERMAINPAETGSLRIIVELAGEPPEPRQLDVGRDPACEHDGPIFSEFVVARDGRLQGALVRVRSGHERWLPPAPPEEPALLHQEGCIYRPHVLGIQVGTPLLVENDDALVHNVHIRARRNRETNLVQSEGAPALRYDFPKPELSIPVQCDLHPWMGAWLHVLEHPWFAVSGEEGIALIEGLPAGDYELELQHEKFGTERVSVTVAAQVETELTVRLGE